MNDTIAVNIRDKGKRGKCQALASRTNDGAEIALGGGVTTIAGSDDAGQQNEGASLRFGAGAVADVGQLGAKMQFATPERETCRFQKATAQNVRWPLHSPLAGRRKGRSCRS
jgi:hypothetical protein